MNDPTMTGAQVRAWRLAWGLLLRECAPQMCYGANALTMVELGYRPVPAYIADYVRAHPAPAEDPTYPPTADGLAAAMAALGMGRDRFATWWGGISAMAVWQWRRGGAPLPVPIRAWLRAGAPRTGRLRPPPPAGHVDAPLAPRPPPAPTLRRRPGPEWVWLSAAEGWVPPAGLCRPGETYGALRFCWACAYRVSCQELTAELSASAS